MPGRMPAWYPGRPKAIAVQVTIRPSDPSSPDEQEFTSLTKGLNSYSGASAVALVEYRDY